MPVTLFYADIVVKSLNETNLNTWLKCANTIAIVINGNGNSDIKSKICQLKPGCSVSIPLPLPLM